MKLSFIARWLVLGAVACAAQRVPDRGTASRARMITMPDGTTLATFTVGVAHRDTLVVPMGSMLLAPLESLAEKRTVIYYDIRGRGRSTGGDDTASISLARDVQDLEAIRGAFSLGRMQLLGWSYGSAIVANYAIEHRDRVRHIGLLNPIAPSATDYGAAAVPAGRDSVAEAALAALQRSGAIGSQPVEHCRLANRIEAAELIADSSARRRRTDLCDLPNEWPSNLMRTTVARLGKLGAYDWRDRLSASRVSLFVIAGTRDFIPVEAAKAWVQGNEARFVAVPNAGHYAFLEAPRDVRQAIERFLDSATP